MNRRLTTITAAALLFAATFASSQTVDNQNTITSTEQATKPTDSPAIAALVKKVAENPKDTQALVNLATAYSDAKNYTEAINTWKKVNELIPTWAPAYYAEAIVHQHAQDTASAKASYEKYISMVKPEEVEANKANLAYAHFYLAYAEQQNNKEVAKQHITKSLQYDPSNQEAVKLSEALAK